MHYFHKIKNYVNGITRNEYGVAAIEFALVLPILLLLLIGSVELTRFVLVNQKVEKVASQIADYVSQVEDPTNNLTAAGLRNSFDTLMSPFGTENSGFAITIVTRPAPEERLEVFYSDGSGMNSRYGAPETIVNEEALNNIVFNDNDTIVSVEVNHTHNNIFGNVLEQVGLLASSRDNSNSEDGGSTDGALVSRESFFVYRLGVALEGRNATAQSVPAIPLTCGYFRDADHDDKNNDEDRQQEGPEPGDRYFLGDGKFDIWPLALADSPHPCQCYAEGARYGKNLSARIASCRPQLNNAPYNCPRWLDEGVFYRAENELDKGYFVKCCNGSDGNQATPTDLACNGCITNTDDFQEATDPTSTFCQEAEEEAPRRVPTPPSPGDDDPNDEPERPTQPKLGV